jgi:hypothetical protein
MGPQTDLTPEEMCRNLEGFVRLANPLDEAQRLGTMTNAEVEASLSGIDPGVQGAAREMGRRAAEPFAKPEAEERALAKSTATSTSSQPVRISKADFVRGLPVDMPSRVVLAMAKVAGISISRTYVRLLRGSDDVERTVPNAAGASAATSTTSTARVAAPPSRPRSSIAKVTRPATAGPSGGTVMAKPSAGARERELQLRTLRVALLSAIPENISAEPPTKRSTSSVEALLRAVAAEVGLRRAVEILEAERAKVRESLGMTARHLFARTRRSQDGL